MNPSLMRYFWLWPKMVTVPDFSDATPQRDKTLGSAGVLDAMPRADHVHPRMTATASGVLDGNGEAEITFTRSFANKPAVSMVLVENATSQPVIFRVKSWTISGTDYVGCVIRGQRTRPLPAVIALLTVLISYDIAAGSASGAEFSFIALERS